MESDNNVDFQQKYLVVWDYLVLIAFLLIFLAVGVYHSYIGSKDKSVQNYLLANSQMMILPVSMSMFASIFSSNLIITMPVEGAIFGTQVFFWFIGCTISILIASFLITPVFYKLKTIDMFEYLEKRFHKNLKLVSKIVYIFLLEFNTCMYLYVPSLSMSFVTGLNEWVFVGSIGAISILYTTIGGMKTVLWTDVLQTVFTFGGLLGIFITGIIKFGSFSVLWKIFEEHDRIRFFNLSFDPRERVTFWSICFCSPFLMLQCFGVNQSNLQRAFCVPTLKKAKIAQLLMIPTILLFMITCLLVSVIIFIHYYQCDPFEIGRIKRIEGLVPMFVMDQMNIPGVPGFIYVAMFSAALSSISSSLNSISAIIYKDFLFLPFGKKNKNVKAYNLLQIITFISGIGMILLTVIVSNLGFVLEAMVMIWAVFGSPILGIFFQGLFIPFCNHKGAIVSFFAGIFFALWIAVNKIIYKPQSIGTTPPNFDISNCPFNITKGAFNTSQEFNLLLNISSKKNFTNARPDISTETFFNVTLQNISNYAINVTSNISSSAVKPTFTKFQDFMMPLYQISVWTMCCFTTLITIIFGLIISFLTGYTRPQTIDPRLFSPVVPWITSCLPLRYRIRKYQQINTVLM